MKAYFSAHSAFICILLLLWAASCKKEKSLQANNPVPAGLQLISSGYASGTATRVEIYAAGNLFVGYNKLYIALYDSASNSRITQAQVSLSALISNETGKLQAGMTENPATTNAVDGLFSAAVIFMTPSGSSGNWTLTMHLQNPVNNPAGDFTAMVNVANASPAKAYSVTSQDDSSNLFVALVQPGINPQIGTDTFEVAVYKENGAMNFVPDSTYMMAINPIMPSMADMTSPNNVNPAYAGNGHYRGKVVFTMYGGWQININLKHNTAIADTTHYFDFNLSI